MNRTANGGKGRRDEAAVRRYVEHMAMMLAEYGFPRMPARVLMVMMTADEDALTAGELAERLEVSPAAISGAVRYLIQVRLLNREPMPGSRRDRYRMPDDAWYEATAIQNRFFDSAQDLSADGVAALGGPGTPAGARVAEMHDFFRFLREEMPEMLKRWEALKTARG